MSVLLYIGNNWERILVELGRHLYIVVLSLPISIILGVTLGILISRNRHVARGLAADPKVILMDEPFGVIDPINRDVLQDNFLEIQRNIQKTL